MIPALHVGLIHASCHSLSSPISFISLTKLFSQTLLVTNVNVIGESVYTHSQNINVKYFRITLILLLQLVLRIPTITISLLLHTNNVRHQFVVAHRTETSQHSGVFRSLMLYANITHTRPIYVPVAF